MNTRKEDALLKLEPLKPLKVENAKFLVRPQSRKIGNVKQFVFDGVCSFEVKIKNNSKQDGLTYRGDESVDDPDSLEVEKGAHRFKIPKGFVCDSTSLPWARDDAGDVHDFGYCVQGSAKGYDKAFWDDVYYYLMLDIGMAAKQANIRFIGVRLFGGRAYKKRRKEKYHAARISACSSIVKTWGL